MNSNIRATYLAYIYILLKLLLLALMHLPPLFLTGAHAAPLAPTLHPFRST